MPDVGEVDKWPSLIQWIAGLGVFVGGAFAALFARRSPPAAEEGHEGVLVVELRLRRDFEQALAVIRQSFHDEIGRLTRDQQQECGEIFDRLRLVETENAVLKVEVEAVKAGIATLKAEVEAVKTRRRGI